MNLICFEANLIFNYNDLNHRSIVRNLDLIERKTLIPKLTDIDKRNGSKLNYRVNTDHCINVAHWFNRVWFLRVTRVVPSSSCCSITSLNFS